MLKIREMFENGFAVRRISIITGESEENIKNYIIENDLKLKKENFDESKIDYICDLYNQGVSAKSLGTKFSIDKRRIQKWVIEKDLLRSKNESHRFTRFNQDIFDVIDTPDKAYWLGFLYADAYNCLKTNTVSLSLQISDLEHLKKLAKFIGLPEDKISYTKNKENYEYYTLKMYSKHLCESLTKQGCPQAKSFIIKYPEWLSKEFDIDFIRGMFDGDGSLARRENGEWKWSLATTKECGESIQNIILDQLKIIVNIRCISKTNNNTYELESNGNEKVLKLSKWLYDSAPEHIRLNRKYDRVLELQEKQNSKNTNHLSRKSFIIDYEDKKKMVDDFNHGTKISLLAKEHKIRQDTVKRIIRDDEFLYEKVVQVNGQPITAKYVKTLDLDERLALVEPLFQHFRQQGWLYPDNDSKIKSNYQKLCQWQPDLSSDELFNNSSLATDICKFFCHKFYDATEEGKPTMREVFENDDKLRYLIKNRLGLDWWDKEDNDETFNISFRMLVQGLRSSRLVPSISIFKPNIAKYMYMKYSNHGDTVYDYSAGWGGRMLGAASCGRKYIGTDPLTTDEIQNMVDFLDIKNVQLINNGSEHVMLGENTVDFSFSSPPYYSQEFYDSDKTQAYNNGEEYFYNTYWANTLDNVKTMLKPGKYFGLNVINFPKMVSMAEERFGKPVELIKLRTVRSHLNKNAGVEKFEPIYVFINNK